MTNPIVIAVRWNLGRSQVIPRGTRSNTMAPPWILGRWNVSAPRSRPTSVFGNVQANPSNSNGVTRATVPQSARAPGVS